MSQENVTVIREAHEAFERGDREGAFKLADPDVTAHRVAPLPDPETFHGIEGLHRLVDGWTSDFDTFEMSGEEFIDRGDRVIVRVRQTATGHGSGAPVEGEFWFVYTVVDGKWSRLEMFNGRDQAIEAAGLRG